MTKTNMKAADLKPGDVIRFTSGALRVLDVDRIASLVIIDYADGTSSVPMPASLPVPYPVERARSTP